MSKQTLFWHFKRCFKLLVKLGPHLKIVRDFCLDLSQRLLFLFNLDVLFSCAAVPFLYPLFSFIQGILLVAAQLQHLIAKSYACRSCHS